MTRIERSEQIALLALGGALALALAVAGRARHAPQPVLLATPGRPAQVQVHVAGEVVWPGLYAVPAGSRVQDAILAAHGPTLVADLSRVNLAAPLRDGDRVVVPRIVQPTLRPDGPQRPVLRAPPALPAPAAGETPRTVNVNTATAADLERLPGIGPVLARRIVEYREAKGLFRRLEDLLDVEGIGPRLLRRLQPLLRLE